MRLVSEDEKYWTANDGKSEFRIAKNGLGHETHKKIAEHFAKGGEVKGYSGEYGNPEDQEVFPSAWQLGGYQNPVMSQADPAQLAAIEATTPKPMDRESMAKLMRGEILPAAPAPVAPMGEPMSRDTMAAAMRGDILPAPPSDVVIPPPPATYAPDPKTAALVSGYQSGQLGTAAGASPQAPPKQPEQRPMSFGIGPSAEEKEVAAASKAAQQAEIEKGALLKQQIESEAALRGIAERDKAIALTKIDTMLGDAQARSMALQKEIGDGKIDPNRLWASKSTGAKFASIIGVVLGGIGGGMMKTGRNSALEVINNATERDVRAQEMELGKKQSLLSSNMQITRDLESAKQLTLAQSKDALATQLEMNAAQYGGDIAVKNASMLASKLRADSAQIMSGLKTNAITRANAQIDLAYKMKMMAGMGQGEQFDKYTVPNALGPGQHIRALPGDDDGAKELRKMNAARMTALNKIDRMIELRDKHGSETTWSKAKDEMDSLLADYTPAYLKSNGLGTLDAGTERLVKALTAGGPAAYGNVKHVLEQLRGRTQSQFNDGIRAYADPRSLGGGPGTQLKTLKPLGAQ